MTELLPCPFCASDDVRIAVTMHESWYYGECESCGGRTDYYDSQDEAIAAWNTRAERTCENPCSVGFECSECGVTCGGYPLKDATRFSWSYCPNCGAKVVGE